MSRDNRFLFLLGCGLIGAIAGAYLLIPRVNPLFAIFQCISVICIVAIIWKYFSNQTENPAAKSTHYSRADMIRDSAYIVGLLGILTVAAFAIERQTLGSLFVTLLASAIAGMVAYILLKSERDDLLKLCPDCHKKPKYLLLFGIFTLGFLLRASIMGWREIPIGNDAPMYMLDAIKGSELPLTQVVVDAFSFTSNPYADSIHFTQLWLALALDVLHFVGLDVFYIPKLVIPLMSAFSILAIYLLGRKIRGEHFGMLAALIFALLPTEVLFAQLYKEVLGELLLILTLVAFCGLASAYLRNQRFSLYGNLAFMLLSLFLLGKAAVTTFTYCTFFLVALAVFTLLATGIVSLRGAFRFGLAGFGGLLVAILIAPIFFGSTIAAFADFAYFRIYEGMFIHPYGYFAFPIMVLTNITLGIIAVYSLYRIYPSFRLPVADRQVLAVALPMLLAVVVISLFLTTTLGYNLLPGSLFYSNIRLAIYAGIPLSLIGAAFLDSLLGSSRTAGLAFVALLLCTFLIGAVPATTIHASLLSPAIDYDSYHLLESLDGTETIYVVGDFATDEYGLNGSGLGYKNWIEFMVYHKTGSDPVFLAQDALLENNNGYLLMYKNNQLTLERLCNPE